MKGIIRMEYQDYPRKKKKRAKKSIAEFKKIWDKLDHAAFIPNSKSNNQ